MANTEKQVATNILNYMNKVGGIPNSWYVGITNNPEETLFNRHNISKTYGTWIYDECFNSESARNIESYFIGTIKTDGGSGGGDENSVFVYAYKKTNQTVEK